NLSRSEIVSMFAVATWPLGTLSIVRSSVRIRVERRPTRSTVPNVPPSLRKSPTRTALSKTREKPPMTFSRVFCRARPTAMPADPKPGQCCRGIDAKVGERRDNPSANDEDVGDPVRESQQRNALPEVRRRAALPRVAFAEVVQQQQQPHRARDEERHPDYR